MDARVPVTDFPSNLGSPAEELGTLLGRVMSPLPVWCSTYFHTGSAAPGTSMAATMTHTTILPICCVCGLIREETGLEPESWVTKKVFRQSHGIDHSAYRLTHTYCPSCFVQFMNRIAAA